MGIMRTTPRGFYRSPDAPCKDCTERKVGCHSECEKYGAYKKGIIETSSKIKKQHDDERMVENYTINEKYKTLKRQGRR